MSHYLIIGASTGIGYELASQLAEAGHSVIGTYNSHKPETLHSNIDFQPFDVLDSESTLTSLPDKLSGVVYCPGSISLRPFERIKPEDFMRDYQLQVVGAIRVLQFVMPKLKQSTEASFVLFSTLAVQTGLPYHSLVSASKGAIEGLVRALSAEYAPGIRVNGIAPSLTDTPLAASLLNTDQKREANAQRHPLKRIGTASDIAHMAAFLLSDKSSWITGQIFPVDGGMSALRV